MNESILFEFSSNWDNKLTSKNHFTTIRQSGRHNIGDKGIISLKGVTMFMAEIVGKTEIALNLESSGGLLNIVAFQDTGYSWAETKKIISKMYGYSPAQLETKTIFIYLIARVKDQPRQETLI